MNVEMVKKIAIKFATWIIPMAVAGVCGTIEDNLIGKKEREAELAKAVADYMEKKGS